MITKETFIKTINQIKSMDELLDKMEMNHIDVCEIPELFTFSEIATTLFTDNFGVKGADTINQWLYEPEYSTIETPEELYDAVNNASHDPYQTALSAYGTGAVDDATIELIFPDIKNKII